MARSKYYFDTALADAAVEFFPRFLRLVDGEWAGRPFVLADWQAHHTRQIFGWRRRSDGMRRYRTVRVWVPRKNGKTEWFAGLGHLLTIGDGEPGAQVFSFATDKDQAKLLFNKAVNMAALSAPLSQHYEVAKTGMFCPALMSSFRPLSGEATGKHGLSPHAALGDECHEWRDSRLHTFLRQGMGARRQPLDAIISTAGEIKTYGHELYLDSEAVLEDPSLDDQCYVVRYAADPADDWSDPKVWAKANPNLGISLKLEYLAAECKRAQRSPRAENDFKRYHLNLWVEQATRWFPMHRWADNTAEPENADLWKALPDRMAHRRGFAGLDLGSTSDITCLVWVFPPEKEGDRWAVIPFFWVPEDTVPLRDSPRAPYRRWISQGALRTTPGNVTDYDFIEHTTMEGAERFECVGLAIDRWNATQVMVHLGEAGLPVMKFGQGYASMGAPSKELERLFMSGQLEHGNHPVLEWMFRNAIYRKDPAGNIKPDKERAAEKIDGVVGTVMGLGLAMEDTNEVSVYSERGVLVM